jgi:HPt (histidine-containing phosphotransfer) domain-containing protein
MTGGKIDLYRKVLSMFRKDAEDRLALLRLPPEEPNLPLFIIHAHSLKSASASIGAAEVSALAARLEAAGKAADMAAIRAELPPFTERLAALAEEIERALTKDAGKTGGGRTAPGETPNKGSGVSNLLRKLAAALEAKKQDAVDSILEELLRLKTDSKTRETLDRISDDVLMAEYGKALESLAKLKESGNYQ